MYVLLRDESYDRYATYKDVTVCASSRFVLQADTITTRLQISKKFQI